MLGAGFDGRTSAIAYGSKLVFDGIGLWPRIAAEAEPILEIRVADDNRRCSCTTTTATSRGETADAARLYRREPGAAPGAVERARALPLCS